MTDNIAEIEAVLKLDKDDIILVDDTKFSMESAAMLSETLKKQGFNNLIVVCSDPINSLTKIQKSKLIEDLSTS